MKSEWAAAVLSNL